MMQRGQRKMQDPPTALCLPDLIHGLVDSRPPSPHGSSSAESNEDRRNTIVAASSYLQLQAAARYRRSGPTRLGGGGGGPVHIADDAYGLTKEEREWLTTLYNRYRQDPLHDDALRDLVWSVDRESMDDAQLRAKVRGIVPAGTATSPTAWAAPASSLQRHHRDGRGEVRFAVQGTPSAASSPSLVSPRTADVLAGRSAYTDTPHNAESMQAPTMILSFEQLMDYAVMVKAQCAQTCMSNQMTLDAFVLLGGHEDGTGEVQIDTLRHTITEFCLNIDVEAFVAAIDKDGDGTISYDEFAWLYNEGLAEVSSPTMKSPSVNSPTGGGGYGSQSGQQGQTESGHHGGQEGTLTTAQPRSAQRLTIVETMAALARGANHSMSARSQSIADAVNQHAAALTPSKRRAAPVRSKPPPVHVHDLHESHETLDCLEEVAATHESRMAYVESLNRKNAGDAIQQGNHLLAEHLRSMVHGNGTESSGVFESPTTPATAIRGRRHGQAPDWVTRTRTAEARKRIAPPTAQPPPPIPSLAVVVAQRMQAQRDATAGSRQAQLSTAKHRSPRQPVSTAHVAERRLALERQQFVVQQAMATLQAAVAQLHQLKHPPGGSRRHGSVDAAEVHYSLHAERALPAAPRVPTTTEVDAETYGDEEFECEDAEPSTRSASDNTSLPTSSRTTASGSPCSAASSSSTFSIASSPSREGGIEALASTAAAPQPQVAVQMVKAQQQNGHRRSHRPTTASAGRGQSGHSTPVRAINPKPLRCKLSSFHPSPPPRTASFVAASRGRLHSAQARLVRTHDHEFTSMVTKRDGTSSQLAVTPRVVADAIKRSIVAEEEAKGRVGEPRRPAPPRPAQAAGGHSDAIQMDRWTRH